jgi:glycosyltransferase involved in cell wall biosynthesis
VRLVGSGAESAKIDLARQCGPAVELTGRVPDVVPHYRDATAVYLPLRAGGGTRIKVIEAFALGRPVLSTAVGIEGLGVAAGEHYLAIEHPADGVAALRFVLAGGTKDLVARARRLVEQRFGHERAVARLRELAADAVTGR